MDRTPLPSIFTTATAVVVVSSSVLGKLTSISNGVMHSDVMTPTGDTGSGRHGALDQHSRTRTKVSAADIPTMLPRQVANACRASSERASGEGRICDA